MSDSAEATPVPAPAVAAPAKPPRRSRAWIWVTVAVVLLCMLVIAPCGLLIVVAATSPDVSGDAVAVIRLDGEISGSSGGSLTGGAGVTPERVIGQLQEAESDDSVRAIVLRIDSPGGTAAASSEIAMEVARCDKPVIASIGDVGASGAYMVASQCDEIVASGSSDVGSIGVIMEVADYSELFKKLGVKFISIHEGEYKDAGASWRSLTATETAMLKSDIHLVYDDFIKTVAKGRDMSEEDVRKLATGWAWPGIRAKQLGLVDRIGNYSDAIDLAARRGGIEGDPRIVTYGSDISSWLQNLTSTMSGLSALANTQQMVLQARPTMR